MVTVGKTSKFVAMNMSKDLLEKVESYRQLFAWTPQQTFLQLVLSEERMAKALERFQPVVLDDGTPAILYTDPTGEKDMLWGQDLEEPCKWLLDELKKPLSQRFTEPYFMYGDPR